VFGCIVKAASKSPGRRPSLRNKIAWMLNMESFTNEENQNE
jgi:hypothetical protein